VLLEREGRGRPGITLGPPAKKMNKKRGRLHSLLKVGFFFVRGEKKGKKNQEGAHGSFSRRGGELVNNLAIMKRISQAAHGRGRKRRRGKGERFISSKMGKNVSFAFGKKGGGPSDPARGGGRREKSIEKSTQTFGNRKKENANCTTNGGMQNTFERWEGGKGGKS